jgi:hypothetical protein
LFAVEAKERKRLSNKPWFDQPSNLPTFPAQLLDFPLFCSDDEAAAEL